MLVSEEVVHVLFNHAIVLSSSHFPLEDFIFITIQQHCDPRLDVSFNGLILRFGVAIDLLVRFLCLFLLLFRLCTPSVVRLDIVDDLILELIVGGEAPQEERLVLSLLAWRLPLDRLNIVIFCEPAPGQIL